MSDKNKLFDNSDNIAEERRDYIFRSAGLDRRQFLFASGALAAGATLASWAPPAHAEVGGQLEIMAYEGYAMEKETEAWRKAHNVNMRSTVIASQDDVTAKFVGDPVRLDLAEYSNGYNDLFSGMGILKEIDLSKIPNFNANDVYPPFFNGEMWKWDNKQWGIPWTWGVDTIVLNPSAVGFEVTSYKDLLRPELKGKIAFMDSPLTAWPQMAKIAGYRDKFPNLTKEEVADVFAKLQPYREQSKVFATSAGDMVSLFANGEIAACFNVWTALPIELAKQNVNTVAIFPVEGPAVWVDAWFITKTAENVDTAHAYINQLLTPEVQAACAKNNAVCSVSKKAPPLMDANTRKLFDYDNFDAKFGSAKIYGQPPRKSDKFATYDDWLQAWSSFKSGF
ncbi:MULTISPECIES: extracellular solute-binding protein [unclassified Mesorhizobium]|uniref:ABC transporter substrate-binding protein n=1 Tax=unclassified Mesorhizobium TaxID=325217 RepID=UPI00241559AF|nr:MULTISPECIES: extracellular solute-binding protein [unclassified Mesorhizobium]MDG4890099.1 extracellular solute-binding protein [Mesorhizobium sp. WSM4887]MDG4904241.1 extracellular solute-binding protein [Mesorhizobium sp. WSM4962]MDG4909268.1 extracellular solute-binding protein [Mesorhizobium sp. WSM4898]MDG4921892.1 extracellular solute-binding protein [Mesorhizobium sp. WSM4989]